MVLEGQVPAVGEYVAAAAGDSPFAPLEPLANGVALPGRIPAWWWPGVPQEQEIPFSHRVLFRHEHFLVAFKPHFLPTTSNGRLVVNTLQTRLRVQEDNPHVTPLHRLDVLTAGVVVCSTNPTTRGVYQRLFQTPGLVRKTYQAELSQPWSGPVGEVELPMMKRAGDPQVRVHDDGVVTKTFVERCSPYHLRLSPVTGHTHQLRVLCNHFGSPIRGDDTYPVVRGRDLYDFSQPLLLVATTLEFDDPCAPRFSDSRCSFRAE
ncbi:Ribosomal large subunit pseudouridine synthase A [Corynebacterium felinum]|nr:Ribosomal large subunit pseudouridine synthase A [Corynebacterium felinum]